MRRVAIALVALMMLKSVAGNTRAQEKQPGADDTRRAIERAVKYLKSQYQPGKGWEDLFKNMQPSDAYQGGSTALVCLALLEAGENPDEGVLKQGLDYLRSIKTTKTYVLSLRLAVLSRVVKQGKANAREADRALMLNDRNALLADSARDEKGKLKGWGYPITGVPQADFSNTHFAVLGLDAAQRAGVETPAEVWREVRDLYLATQLPSGGWPYPVGVDAQGARLTMTLAALAGLEASCHHLKEKPPAAAVGKAVAFVEKYYLPDTFPFKLATTPTPFPYYMLMALSRSAVPKLRGPDGQPYDSAAATASKLLTLQKPDGSWAEPQALDGAPGIATSMAVILLARSK